ncbi:hypothetical protein [Georgenia wangjunii]
MISIVSRTAASAAWYERIVAPTLGAFGAGVRLRPAPTGKPEGRPVRNR